MSGTRSASPKAPATKAALAGARLLIVGYGSRGGRAGLAALGRGLTQRGPFAETAVATLFGAPRLEEVVPTMAGAPTFLVPLLMARGVTYRHLQDRLAAIAAENLVLCPELGRHPGLAATLAAQGAAGCAARGWAAAETGLLLVGHGTRRRAASRRATVELARRVAGLGRFAEVTAGFLEDRPSLEVAAEAMTAPHLLALGCFAEAGRHARRDLPRRLAGCVRPPAAGGTIGEAPGIADLILEQALSTAGRARRASA